MGLTQGIHRAVQLYTNRPALVAEGVARDWATFADRVARLAGVLTAHGVGAGDRVAMLGHNSPRFVEYYFATLWAGAVMVPVNTRWALPEKIHCLNDSGARLLLVDGPFAGEADALRRACPGVESLVLSGSGGSPGHGARADDGQGADATGGALDYETALAQARAVPDARRGGEDLAALFYTGGTTGRAKGVMLSHDNFLANSMNALVNLGITADSVHLHVSPLFHVAGGSRVFTTTVAGGTHAVIPRFEPDLFLEAIARFKVTVTVVVPTMLNALLHLHHVAQFTDADVL